MAELENPELQWQREQEPPPITREDVASRIGSVDAPLEVLCGGLANTNIRVGRDRVLRIYCRDPTV